MRIVIQPQRLLIQGDLADYVIFTDGTIEGSTLWPDMTEAQVRQVWEHGYTLIRRNDDAASAVLGALEDTFPELVSRFECEEFVHC